MVRFLVLKYGVGNIYSVRAGLERLGVEVVVAPSLEKARKADAIILPGVGAYSAAMKRLAAERDLLVELVEKGTPILGICLGMQLFFEESEEGGRGLGLLPGRVTRLQADKLPHIGWSKVTRIRDSELLADMDGPVYFYFVHSYAYVDTDKPWVKAVARHGQVFASVIEQYPLYGPQFHPERSGRNGARVLRNFVGIVKR